MRIPNPYEPNADTIDYARCRALRQAQQFTADLDPARFDIDNFFGEAIDAVLAALPEGKYPYRVPPAEWLVPGVDKNGDRALALKRGKRYATFASYCFGRVRYALLEEMRRQDPLSRWYRDKVKAAQERVDALEEKARARALTPDEIEELEGLRVTVAQSQLARPLSLDQVRLGESQEGLGENTPAPGLTPEEALIASLDAARLHAALDRLAPHLRNVVELLYLDGCGIDAVKGRLRQSNRQVRSRETIALAMLREYLREASPAPLEAGGEPLADTAGEELTLCPPAAPVCSEPLRKPLASASSARGGRSRGNGSPEQLTLTSIFGGL